MTRVLWWIQEKDVMFAMSQAGNGGPTEGTQALLRHTFLDQTQPFLAYITGVIFSRFQASRGKRGASLRSWRDKWECCSLPRAQESRQLRRLTRSERGAPDTLDGGRHRKNSAIYFFLRLSSWACLALFTHFTLTFARLKSLKTWNVSSSIMHGSIWPVTIPGDSPALPSRGWEIVWRGPFPVVGGGANKKITSDFAKHVLFLHTRSLWLIVIGSWDCVLSRENTVIVREWLERNNLSQEHMIVSCLSKLKSVFAGMFWNFKRIQEPISSWRKWVWCVLEWDFLQKKQRNISSAQLNDKTTFKICTRTQDF